MNATDNGAVSRSALVHHLEKANIETRELLPLLNQPVSTLQILTCSLRRIPPGDIQARTIERTKPALAAGGGGTRHADFD